MADPVRIAMWSGPRTLSTALMRSFENRSDTVVVDEPLYGFYLARTGSSHPGRDEVIASMPVSWPDVVTALVSGPVPAGCSVYYQKHMTHHLLPDVDRSALAGLRHAFLIRDPRRLLASYARVRDTPTLADLGLAQQAELFRLFGGPVIDAADLAARPRAVLAALCAALGIGFDEAMLSWPAGSRPTDGVWGKYWYASVWASTGFRAPDVTDAPDATPVSAPPPAPPPAPHSAPLPAPHSAPASAAPPAPETSPAPANALPAELEPLAAQCQPFYDELAAHKLTCP